MLHIISHTGLWFFGCSFPISHSHPGLGTEIVSRKPNIHIPGHFLEGGLARSWAGVGHTRLVVMSKPLHLELAANIISWNHVKWVSFSLKKIFPRPLKVRNSKKAIIRNQVFFTVNPFHQASWQYHSHEGLLWLG